MNVKLECRAGHPLESTSWIDAEGNLRMIVSACSQCDAYYIRDEAEELAREMVKDIRGGCVGEPAVFQLL